MRFLLGCAIVAILGFKVAIYAQVAEQLEMKKAEPVPQMDQVVPLENEKRAIEAIVPESQIPVSNSNLVIFTSPGARIDIYDIHFVYRGVDANVSDGWTLYEKYMDAVAQPIMRNKRADKDGMFEVKLPAGTYAVGACDKEHRLGSTDIFKIEDNLAVKQIDLRNWGQK